MRKRLPQKEGQGEKQKNKGNSYKGQDQQGTHTIKQALMTIHWEKRMMEQAMPLINNLEDKT